jgi:TIR domain
MSYANACFISYKNPPIESHVAREFVDTLVAILEYYLASPIRVYCDTALRTRPGIPYPAALSSQLCRSVCMVAVLTPEYIESSWCMAEWHAMESLEQQRLSNNRGLIIPILFKGSRQMFEPTVCGRTVMDLNGLLKPSRQLNTLPNRQKIRDIAFYIDDYVKVLRSNIPHCDGFKIPVGKDQITLKVLEPSPFGNYSDF